MTKIDKKGTLLDLTDLIGIEKIYKEEKSPFSMDSIKFIFKDSHCFDGKRVYVHMYPSRASMDQWFSIITKKIQGEK